MSPSSHDPLSHTLAEWRVRPARNPHFRAAVWARVEAAARPSTWTRFARTHPAAVSGILAAAVLLGALTGRTEARQHEQQERAAIAANYVHALDARWMRHP